MLNPAGDARSTGRTIDDTFERGLTLQCAEQIKKQLEEHNPYIRVLLTREPGEIVLPLQSASFANRLKVNLFVSIHLYQESGIKPHLYLYQFSYGDDFMTHTPGLALYPYDQAHLFNGATTTAYAQCMHTILCKKEYAQLFSIHGIYKMPFKPVIGITAPALGLEASIKNKDEWRTYVAPICEAIEQIVYHTR
jgi:hypothetical protein